MVGERTLSVGGRMRLANVILRRAAASFALAAVIRSRFSARARASSTDDPMFFNFLRTSRSRFDAASRGEAPALLVRAIQRS